MLFISLWLDCIMLDWGRMPRLGKCADEWGFGFVGGSGLCCEVVHQTGGWWEWLHALESCGCLAVRVENWFLRVFFGFWYRCFWRFLRVFFWKIVKVRLGKSCFFSCRMYWICGVFTYENFIWRWFAQFLLRIVSCHSCRERLFSCFLNKTLIQIIVTTLLLTRLLKHWNSLNCSYSWRFSWFTFFWRMTITSWRLKRSQS